MLTQPSRLANEVRFPEDRMPNSLARVADFLSAGIPHVPLIDPDKRTGGNSAPTA